MSGEGWCSGAQSSEERGRYLEVGGGRRRVALMHGLRSELGTHIRGGRAEVQATELAETVIVGLIAGLGALGFDVRDITERRLEPGMGQRCAKRDEIKGEED